MIEYMRDSRPISNADEFQIIDIGNLALREVECNFLFLKSELNIVTSFQKKKKQYGERDKD